jgi:hypothetical protein
MKGNIVEQIIFSRLIQWSAMELEVYFNWFLQTLRQLFKIKNICTNNLPLQVEPFTIWMCSKVELFLHPIPISLCNSTHMGWSRLGKWWHHMWRLEVLAKKTHLGHLWVGLISIPTLIADGWANLCYCSHYPP